jgi:hypothetical protein
MVCFQGYAVTKAKEPPSGPEALLRQKCFFPDSRGVKDRSREFSRWAIGWYTEY